MGTPQITTEPHLDDTTDPGRGGGVRIEAGALEERGDPRSAKTAGRLLWLRALRVALVAATALAFGGAAVEGAGVVEGSPQARFTLPRTQLDDAGRMTSALREGYVTLTWSVGDDGETADCIYQLQSALSKGFGDALLRYEGRDAASFISGLEEGDHFFRVRAREATSETWGPWSDPVVIPVRHHSKTLAAWLLGAGALIFALTVSMVVVSSRRSDLVPSDPAEGADG